MFVTGPFSFFRVYVFFEGHLKLRHTISLANQFGVIYFHLFTGVSVAATLVCVAIATVILTLVHRRRARRHSSPYRSLVSEEPFEVRPDYGTSGTQMSGNSPMVSAGHA